jgi:hypothetical protein
MSDFNKNADILTEEDRLLTGIILVGCTKMICNIINTNIRSYTNAAFNQQIKSLAYNSVLINLPKIIEENSMFRPADVRRILPEDKVNKIQYADLTRLLEFLVNIQVIQKVDEDSKKIQRKRPGHPFKHDNNTATTITGPKSLYEPSEFYYNVQNVLSKSKAVSFIHTLMLESGLLYKYRKYIELFIIYVIKNKKYDKKTAWKICKSVFPLTSKEESDFEKYYMTIRSISDNKKLQKLVERRALLYVRKHKDNAEDYIELYRIGGYHFRLYPN